MRRSTRHTLFIIAAQSVCLAVGLWMHHWCTVSAAVQVARDQTQVELQKLTPSVAARFATPPSPDQVDEMQAHIHAFLNEHSPGSKIEGILWLDAGIRIRNSIALGPRSATMPANIGQWTPGTELDANRLRNGLIRINDRQYLASSTQLDGDDGTVVVYCSIDVVDAQAIALLKNATVIDGITFVWMAVLFGIGAYVLVTRLHDAMAVQQSRAASNEQRQAQQLVRTRDAVILGLARLAESRDEEISDHLERISVYVTTLAAAARNHPKFRDEMSPSFMRLIGISSALHDIGKVGVEDRILRKPGPLTTAERRQMQTHATIGGDCLQDMERRFGRSDYLHIASEIAYCHHERWDGGGYPQGLSGSCIPLSARIVAISDVYDALSSRRVYKQAFSHSECVAIMKKEAGKHFDPDLMDVWLTVADQYAALARKFASHRHPDNDDESAESLPYEYSSKKNKVDAVPVAALCGETANLKGIST